MNEIQNPFGVTTETLKTFKSPDCYSMTVTWSDEDCEFVVRSPEWPGLSAFGITRAAAMYEAEIALAAMIETAREHRMEMPLPITYPQK